MVEVIVSEEKHKEELIACADRAFGDELPKGGFAGLLPKLYGPSAKVGGKHFIAVEDGKFLGVVLTENMRYTVLEKELKIGCIGTVSVVEEARGRGIMKQLMDAALDSLREEGCDLAFLGGQRQRYAYWGFEGCGTQTRFHWNQANLKHGPRPGETERIQLVPMGKPCGEGNPAGPWEEDPELTEQAWRVYGKEPVRVWRSPKRFFDILCSWQAKPYACMRQGAFAGYVALCADPKGKSAAVNEMVLEKGVSAAAVLHALADCLGIMGGTITVDYGKQDIMRELEEICESESLGCGHRFLIMNWPKVLGAMLELRQYGHPIQDGEAALGITELSGKRIVVRIRVRQGQIIVTEEERKEPRADEVELTAAKAARMLFRSTQTYYRELEGIPKDWFPLPLYVAEQDCC